MGEVAEKKEITLDDLAEMVAKGFEDVTSRMATKEELAAVETNLRAEIAEVKKEILSLESSLR